MGDSVGLEQEQPEPMFVWLLEWAVPGVDGAGGQRAFRSRYSAMTFLEKQVLLGANSPTEVTLTKVEVLP